MQLSLILLISFIVLLIYIFYTKIWRVYQTIYYYKSHGVPFHPGMKPILGSFPEMLKIAKNMPSGGNHPYIEMLRKLYPEGKDIPPITGLAYGQRVCLSLNRPEPTEAVMLTQNKYFDKHPSSRMIAQKALGDSIVFAKSDIQWQMKRKALSGALYKDKLKGMIEKIKESTLYTIEKEWTNQQVIDIVSASSNLFMRITLACLFGKHENQYLIKQKKDGIEVQEPAGQAMQKIIEQSLGREYSFHMILFPELFPLYLTPFERELSYNVDQVRSFLRSMIQERRQNPESLEQSSDLLSILIRDPTFASIDETHIIDEAITFFMAGSLTQATLLANTICYLIQNRYNV